MKRGRLQEVVFGVQPDADAVGDAAAASGALVRRGLRDRLDLQLLDLVAIGIALDARQPGVDDVTDARHRERSLGDVRRQHDAAAGDRGTEDLVLLFRREPRKERQDLRAGRVVLAQRLGRFADLALARKEHQHVAPAGDGTLVDSVDERIHQRAVIGIVDVGDRPVAHLDRVQPTRDLDHRRGRLRRSEVPREALGIDRRRRDDQLSDRAGAAAAA